MCRVVLRFVNNTMSAFVIREMTNNRRYSTLLKTHVWIISSRNIRTSCESEESDCPCKVGIAPLYRNSLCASRLTLLFQVQEIVLRKMRCTHSNIWVELFWNSVVNTTEPLISSSVLFWKPRQSTFTFTTKHSVSTTWCWRQQQNYSENNSSAFLCVYIWAMFCKSSHTVT